MPLKRHNRAMSVVVWGIGQLGAVFSHALLRSGRVVHPVTRDLSIADITAPVNPEFLVLSVGEKDFASCISQLPAKCRDRTVLVQNDILPNDYSELSDPTVAVVWFEKKRNTAVKPILPTPIAGPHAGTLVHCLSMIGIPAQVISSDMLCEELVIKNLYIMTINIAGLDSGGSVGELFRDHADLVEAVAQESFSILEARANYPGVVDFDRCFARIKSAVEADLGHPCCGRSAPSRLQRALDHAAAFRIDTPTILEIHKRLH